MTVREWFAADAEETIAVGAEIAGLLRPPVMVLLSGTLGAGKTTLMKGVVQALGAARQEDVSSPTFTLVHEYAGAAAQVYHLDVYRLERERELGALGLEEMQAGDAYVFVEWGDKFEQLCAEAECRIDITSERGGRLIRLSRQSD